MSGKKKIERQRVEHTAKVLFPNTSKRKKGENRESRSHKQPTRWEIYVGTHTHTPMHAQKVMWQRTGKHNKIHANARRRNGK